LLIVTLTCSLALFDAFLCSENNLKDVEAYLKEVSRVLKTGGVYIMISHGQPEKRMMHLEKYLNELEIQTFSVRKF
jgi:ubiquinone/menaquinone biosynthesis C-methylase UbiE